MATCVEPEGHVWGVQSDWIITSSFVNRGTGGRRQETVDFAFERSSMVQRLVQEGLLRSPEVIAALSKVPRELFVSERLRLYAYSDTPLPTGQGQTISAPHSQFGWAIHGCDNERGFGTQTRTESSRSWCWKRIPRSHDRRTNRT